MLDEKTKRTLSDYLNDQRRLPNESAITHRFASLIESLFPGTTASINFAAGVEKVVRIDRGTRQGRGRIDAYFGNAILEFERSLRATGEDAKRQLREYTAGVWKSEGGPKRPLVCIAADGVVWRSYRPRWLGVPPAKIRADRIELEELRELVLRPETLGDFWLWLTSLLFREGRVLPTAEQFRIDFGATSPAFADAMDALRQAWRALRGSPEAGTAIETWHKYLTYTYGQLGALGRPVRATASGRRRLPEPESQALGELEELFLKHTYLISMARILVWASLSGGRIAGTARETAGEVLSGRYFRSEKIENLAEDDFFQWAQDERAEGILAPIWERILAQMQTYELGRLGQDVLKAVYQELVDPKDRHDLGEYYTPDWLCDRIVAELIPGDPLPRVLDPTCGSGSFLRATISRLRKVAPPGDRSALLRTILDHVVGIDIHPVAVTIAKATYLLALGDLVREAKRPIQVPIYLADSLFLPSEVRQLRFGEVPGYEIRFGGDRSVSVPETLVQLPELFDPAIAACTRIATDHARTGRESEGTLRAYVAQSVPGLPARADFDAIAEALWTFTNELADLIRHKKDSIWAFIVRNSYRPAMFRDHFDVIVGNPPWLSYRYIADPDYQKEVKKRALQDYGIAPESQKLMTQMELATVFLVHTLSTFGRDQARLGFVMPRSVLSADQHAPLRERTYRAPVCVERYWDLMDVAPIFKVPSCVLFARKVPVSPSTSYTLPAVEWMGRLGERDAPWPQAEGLLTAKETTARVTYLGSRSALTTGKERRGLSAPSRYEGRFRQGATLVPRNFYFVRLREANGRIDADKVYSAETDPEQAVQAKPPYRDVKMKGEIEGRFLFSTALSRHVLPFALLEPAIVALPIVEVNGRLEVRSADRLRKEGYRELAAWMSKAERIWAEKRRGKAEKQTLYEWLDYNGKLTAQSLRKRHLVLYNAAGTNLSAVRIDRRSLPLPFVVEHKLYWASCDDEREANYLAAILNASTVNEMIKPFQSRGLMGERDIEKKVLSVPIPKFNVDDPAHLGIADLGSRSHDEARQYLSQVQLPKSLGTRRSLVREALHNVLEEIDHAVRSILRRN